MSVSDRSRPASPQTDDAAWSRVVAAVVTIALFLTGLYLWGRLALPRIAHWAFTSVGDELAVTVTCWAMVAAPLLLLSAAQARKAMLARGGRVPGPIERRATRAALVVGLVPLIPLLPGRGPATRQEWEWLVTRHGDDFERAVTWSLFGGLAVYVVGTWIIMQRMSRAPGVGWHRSWAALAAIAAMLPLLALIIRVATLA